MNKCNVCRLNDTWVDDSCVNPMCEINLKARARNAVLEEAAEDLEEWADGFAVNSTSNTIYTLAAARVRRLKTR